MKFYSLAHFVTFLTNPSASFPLDLSWQKIQIQFFSPEDEPFRLVPRVQSVHHVRDVLAEPPSTSVQITLDEQGFTHMLTRL